MTPKHIRAANEPPLPADEVVTRDDIPASQPVPKEIEIERATAQLFVSSLDGDADRVHVIEYDKEHKAAWRIQSPGRLIHGLAGRTAERSDPGALPGKRPATNHNPAFCPPWEPRVFSPRISLAPSFPALHNKDGRRVEPFYGVYPPDVRTPYYPSGYPWRCIGRVFTWNNASSPGWAYSGSGVMVGPRVVLTAGHMVPWGATSWKMLFVPAYYDGQSTLGPGVQSWVSDAHGWNSGGATAHDMAVLRLYNPLGNSLGWFGSKTFDDGWEGPGYWELIGYPGAIAGAQRPSYQTGIPVLDTDGDGDAKQIEHHGSATPGDSGGPFFSFWSDGFPYVVGTVSGGETISGGFLGIGNEDNNICAGGKSMVDIIQFGLSNWP